MTLPCERVNAIKNTREFLRALINPKVTPRVPGRIRRWASSCLRHYPWDFYIDDMLNAHHHDEVRAISEYKKAKKKRIAE